VKLYDIPKGSKILLPITDGKTTVDELCTFGHLDGAYSYIETPKGAVVHLSASAPLKKVGDHYELDEDDD
jgi:hypothetical protein